jgi:hypothetical protein
MYTTTQTAGTLPPQGLCVTGQKGFYKKSSLPARDILSIYKIFRYIMPCDLVIFLVAILALLLMLVFRALGASRVL